MKLSNEQRNLLDELSEEYATRYRRGESPDIEDYVRRHPELGDDIRELFPVVTMLDQAGDQPDAQTAGEPTLAPGVDHEIGPGTLLGDYRLVRVIGRGGMGVVYQAEHGLLGNTTAIKLLPGTLDRHNLRERFLREASAAARMNHPNIVRVFDFGSHASTLYYVMPLVEGCGLHQMMSSAPGSSVDYTNRAPLDSLDPCSASGRVAALYHDLSATEWGPTENQNVAPEYPQGDDNKATRVDLRPLADRARSTALPGGKTSEESTEVNLDKTVSQAFSERHRQSSPRNDLQSPWGTRQSLWHWAADLGAQAADGLAYAHEMGVIHRDVKPSNLMLDLQGTLYLMDFGLAKIASDNTLTGTGDVLGTLRYIPPEALSGISDARGDIYGLGLTLYELLCGQAAFCNRDRGRLVNDISRGNIARLHKRIPRVPRDLERIVHKAIELDPLNRYQTAAQMRDDLQRFLNGRPVTARRASLHYRVSRWVARNQIITCLTTGLILLLTLTAMMFGRNSVAFKQLAEDAQQSEQRAKLNLLSAKLSDARGWSTSRMPGQRINGFASLREAIALAREQELFEELRPEIQEVAVKLSTLHDMPPGDSWRHETPVTSYDPIAFNADLSVYAIGSHAQRQVGVYTIAGGRPKQLDEIPLAGTLFFHMEFSLDGRFLLGTYRSPGNALWVYDVHDKKVLETNIHTAGPRSAAFVASSTQLIVLDSTTDLRWINLPGGEVEREFSLPKDVDWSCIELSQDQRKLLVYGSGYRDAIIVTLADLHIERLGLRRPIKHAAWRPDDRQIAFASSEISIWDVEQRRVRNSIPHSNRETTHIRYSGDGRLLLTSGWDHVTNVFDPLSERQVMRCEALMLGLSADGKQVVLHTGSRFERRQIISSDVVAEYRFPAQSFSVSPVIESRTGTAWLAFSNTIKVIDLLHRRVLGDIQDRRTKPCVTCDPLGRDVFFCLDRGLLQLPIHEADPMGESGASFEIGPPRVIDLPDEMAAPHTVSVSADGQKLGVTVDDKNCQLVIFRDENWTSVHMHGSQIPVQLHAHPHLPLAVTATHHSTEVQVRNTQTGNIEFELTRKQCNTRFTPDGQRLIVGADARLQAFDVGTWKLAAECSPDIWFDANAAFSISQDGRWLATDQRNPRGVVILDAVTLLPALRLGSNHLQPESKVGKFSSDGRWLISERGPGVVGIWDFSALHREFDILGLPWPLGDLGTRETNRSNSNTDVANEKTTSAEFGRELTLHLN